MTTVFSIDRTGGGSDLAININKLADALFAKVGTEAVKNGFKTTYSIASGDQRYPSTVVVQAKLGLDPLTGTPNTRNCLIAFNSWARTEVDGVLSDIKPISAVLTLNVPATIQFEDADVWMMVENLLAVLLITVSAGEPVSLARLSQLAGFGVTTILG